MSVSEAVPDVIMEIRYYSTYNFVAESISGYEEPVVFLTKEAASALREVSDELLRQGYQLKIYDAYRPQSASSISRLGRSIRVTPIADWGSAFPKWPSQRF